MVTSPDYIHVGEKLSAIGHRVLYMRFPLKAPPSEKIKELHPGIISIRYPRQKSARFCHVIFTSKEVATQARKQLNKQKYGEKGRLVVRDPKSKKQLNTPGTGFLTVKEEVTECNRLWIGQLPADTTTEQIRANFPGCTWTKVFKKSRGKKNLCSALCVFSSHKEASTILNNPDVHKINDVPIIVQCAKHLTGGPKLKKVGINTSLTRERTKRIKRNEKIITIRENSAVNSVDEEDSIQILSTQSNQKKEQRQEAVVSSPKHEISLLRNSRGRALHKKNEVGKRNKTNGITTVNIESDSEIEEVDSDKSDEDKDEDEDDMEEDEEEEGEDEGMQEGSGEEESDGVEDNDGCNEDGEVETVELSEDDGGEDGRVETVSISDDGIEGSSYDDEKENMSIDDEDDGSNDTDSEVVEVDKSDDSGKVDSDGAGEVFQVDDSDDSTKVDSEEIGVDDSDSEDSDDDEEEEDDDDSTLEN